MSTLTYLEDSVRDSVNRAQDRLNILQAAKIRLQQSMNEPVTREQHQQFTLLLEAVIQAEDIIRVIVYRYHNQPVKPDDENEY
ncbi:EscE/YscE/SsaE family type III secretion system needle protein co-chaperone [Morganella morganii]|uniref:EscE/YscE/SsaE family type III secretion system needle protein co-chaperone n=1 Tax=Morganella morganii TaxID=582 RepID=A0AAN5RZK8_MORMO|nr:EscE/YscE/SsaE family type III secretion system needle protein co-chaperone [Morganella morganii]MCU6212978.1 EscE/YscE/SsaE family type III secretion system needle protein co-chaperone [Morganella morganii]MCU6225525.1 EscE/YscE/SsaE family type III secretion system needle protein co-chaperone [Morganella morganii]MCU6232644.1 EscE/YscE/SsaE family type III secretion system needle protein co-chaperone [Morganella morganii]MCU6237509.1 EscE/YscE/SsaE family type III secretion system needle p